MIVGLTGGIGSGKSTVARMFAAHGVPTYDSDREAKVLMNTDENLIDSISSLFGTEAYESGHLNRAYIASRVFKDKPLLQKLNNLVHPAVRLHFSTWAKEQDFKYVIQETALIFENQMQDLYDEIILVTAPIEIRIERIISRDEIDRSSILERMSNQLDDDEKVHLSDYVIENITMEATQKKVTQIHQDILKKTA